MSNLQARDLLVGQADLPQANNLIVGSPRTRRETTLAAYPVTSNTTIPQVGEGEQLIRTTPTDSAVEYRALPFSSMQGYGAAQHLGWASPTAYQNSGDEQYLSWASQAASQSSGGFQGPRASQNQHEDHRQMYAHDAPPVGGNIHMVQHPDHDFTNNYIKTQRFNNSDTTAFQHNVQYHQNTNRRGHSNTSQQYGPRYPVVHPLLRLPRLAYSEQDQHLYGQVPPDSDPHSFHYEEPLVLSDSCSGQAHSANNQWFHAQTVPQNQRSPVQTFHYPALHDQSTVGATYEDASASHQHQIAPTESTTRKQMMVSQLAQNSVLPQDLVVDVATSAAINKELKKSARARNSKNSANQPSKPSGVKKQRPKPKKMTAPTDVPSVELSLPLNEYGMYFDSALDASQKTNGLNWPPRDDATLPVDLSARREVVKELLAAMNDVSSIEDKIGDVLINRWLPDDFLDHQGSQDDGSNGSEWVARMAAAVNKFYAPWIKEKACWELADTLERLYREGTHFITIVDPGLLRDAEKWRDLTFLERKDKCVELLKCYKSRADKLLCGSSTQQYALVVGKLLKESKANRINNDRRQRDLIAGRKRDDRKLKTRGRPSKKESSADLQDNPTMNGSQLDGQASVPDLDVTEDEETITSPMGGSKRSRGSDDDTGGDGQPAAKRLRMAD
ncbi:hypothetical protein CC86DRAFT_469993 [Ophiobolus disseminans]|uniref:Uncharacterized protein n=1 Tax=Ophiobolus disseminans TaxID=1469910 RepID=A0A6A6ZPA1_9PLEO|nr:hypothetical protein CC86DRAFT_469993 [Ophiobolus disseminans]